MHRDDNSQMVCSKQIAKSGLPLLMGLI